MALIIAGGMALTGWIGFWWGKKNHCMVDGESLHSCVDCSKIFKAAQLDCNWRCVPCQNEYAIKKVKWSKELREKYPHWDDDACFDP